ncbi:MAG: CpaF family protein, partial [Candidatus Wallbacteria bacterium]|nr:CpaF family protein [Candidatus Wallbacteria bacterium]
MMADLGPAKDENIQNEKTWYSEQVSEAIAGVLDKRKLKLPEEVIAKIKEDILEGILGFGPLQKLLEDSDVTEIMVNGPSKVFVEIAGKLYLSAVTFASEETLRQVIEKIVIPLNRRVDETCPMTDARLPDGSRVNIVIRPLSLSGSTVTIRKFQKIPLKLANLVTAGTLSKEMATFVEGCVRSKLNIVVSGETGSGKTTTLNALSSFLPHEARIITIEDSAELQLQQDHVVQLEARQANIEGRGEVTIRGLLRNAL